MGRCSQARSSSAKLRGGTGLMCFHWMLSVGVQPANALLTDRVLFIHIYSNGNEPVRRCCSHAVNTMRIGANSTEQHSFFNINQTLSWDVISLNRFPSCALSCQYLVVKQDVSHFCHHSLLWKPDDSSAHFDFQIPPR